MSGLRLLGETPDPQERSLRRICFVRSRTSISKSFFAFQSTLAAAALCLTLWAGMNYHPNPNSQSFQAQRLAAMRH